MSATQSRSVWIGALLFIVPGVVLSILYARQPGFVFVTVASCALLAGGAAFLVGTLFGFLFGFPRNSAQDQATQERMHSRAGQPLSGYHPNTNLEQISDWLTKILVGVGLTQLAGLSTAISNLAAWLSPVLGGATHSGAFGVILVLYNCLGGFFTGFLWTRLTLGMAFGVADVEATQVGALEAKTVHPPKG